MHLSCLDAIVLRWVLDFKSYIIISKSCHKYNTDSENWIKVENLIQNKLK